MTLDISSRLEEFKNDQKKELQFKALAFAEEIAKFHSKQVDALAMNIEGHIADQVARNQPSMVDLVIDDMLNADKHPSYSYWINGNTRREQVKAILEELQTALKMKNGNACRQAFEGLWTEFMNELDVKPSGNDLNTWIEDLKNEFNNAVVGDDVNLVNRVRFAAHAIRAVGNEKSHYSSNTTDRHLSEADIVQLCGNVGVIGNAIGALADRLRQHRASRPLPVPPIELIASPKLARTTTSPTISTLNPTLTSNLFTCTSPTTRMPPPPHGGWLGVAAKTLAAAPSPMWKYLEPHEIDASDGRQRLQFSLTKDQYWNAKKAQLCSCQDKECARSHSYLEVMSYNPLFKQFPCRQDHHFSMPVQERDDCVGIHVDTGIKMSFPEDKKKMCTDGERCNDVNCLKSHIFEEVCWYNPTYKTQECSKHFDGLARPWCPFYHPRDTTDRRNNINDLVGKEIQVPFIERTHKALATKLEALRDFNRQQQALNNYEN